MGYPEGWSADSGCYYAPEHDMSSEAPSTGAELPEGYHDTAGVTDGTTVWTNHPRGGNATPYASIPEQK